MPKKLTPNQIAADLKSFIELSYPAIDIRVAAWRDDPTRLAIYFTDPKFALIYPQQRWHYITHLIPADYQDEHLKDTVWFELAPGENPEELRYPDDELIDAITSDVMNCLKATRFFELLDDAMAPQEPTQERANCWGDYRNARPILLDRGFTEDEHFDVFHVLMRQGGYCDCEILFNVAERSRLKEEYWNARADPSRSFGPHRRGLT